MNAGISDWKAHPPSRTHLAMTVGGQGMGGSGGPGGLGKPLRMDLHPLEKPRTGLTRVASAHPGRPEAREGEGAPHSFGECTPARSLGLENSRKPGTALSLGQRGHSRKPKDRNGGWGGAVATQEFPRLPDSQLSTLKLKQLEPGGSGRLGWRQSQFPPWAGGQVSPSSPHFLPRLGSAPSCLPAHRR